MKKVTIDLFSLDELDMDAKSIAINEHKEFLLSIFDASYYEGENYTYSQYNKDLKKKDIIESIEANNYLFFNSGKMAHCLQYMENNKCTKHVFIIDDIEYIIED